MTESPNSKQKEVGSIESFRSKIVHQATRIVLALAITSMLIITASENPHVRASAKKLLTDRLKNSQGNIYGDCQAWLSALDPDQTTFKDATTGAMVIFEAMLSEDKECPPPPLFNFPGITPEQRSALKLEEEGIRNIQVDELALNVKQLSGNYIVHEFSWEDMSPLQRELLLQASGTIVGHRFEKDTQIAQIVDISSARVYVSDTVLPSDSIRLVLPLKEILRDPNNTINEQLEEDKYNGMVGPDFNAALENKGTIFLISDPSKDGIRTVSTQDDKGLELIKNSTIAITPFMVIQHPKVEATQEDYYLGKIAHAINTSIGSYVVEGQKLENIIPLLTVVISTTDGGTYIGRFAPSLYYYNPELIIEMIKKIVGDKEFSVIGFDEGNALEDTRIDDFLDGYPINMEDFMSTTINDPDKFTMYLTVENSNP